MLNSSEDRPVWLVINILNVVFFAEWVYRDGHTCLCPLQAIRPACVDLFLLTPNKLSHSVCKISLSVECNRQPLPQRDLRPAVNLSDLLDAPFGLLQPRWTHGRGSSFARRDNKVPKFRSALDAWTPSGADCTCLLVRTETGVAHLDGHFAFCLRERGSQALVLACSNSCATRSWLPQHWRDRSYLHCGM